MSSQPERDTRLTTVPNVIGRMVRDATSTVEGADLVPSYQDKDGNHISNPNGSWYVQSNGESPAAGSEVNTGTTVTLTIDSKGTAR